MTKPIIKTTSAEDIPALQEVLDRTGLFPSDLLPDMLAPTIAGETEAFCLTCLVDEKVGGLCYTIPEEFAPGTWNMLALAVHPDLQGRRLGTALVSAVEQQLIAQQQRILIVDTSGAEAFARTRQFYGKAGYQEEARIRDFWAEGDDKITFRKAL
ncbi:GNAT family N-acetyltransferase [Cognatiyoonia sp. IB215446]|uniref:GNAT family N-acetyltransferase n=1 Tax=Cognatiyoonia sp. IB215446 TaxID=3097355 RepID=UPI002A0CBA04|nr:GNAT family N-acetyltransferase [Cognatiyoonia sp. IB215446]MDX8347892.1 GNAT family N-acetyltransferase [Cognatiyoonia sp. IB215446]